MSIIPAVKVATATVMVRYPLADILRGTAKVGIKGSITSIEYDATAVRAFSAAPGEANPADTSTEIVADPPDSKAVVGLTVPPRSMAPAGIKSDNAILMAPIAPPSVAKLYS